jgi:perosamine synthetase
MVMQLGTPMAPAQDQVPLAQPYLNGRELELVGEVLRSGQLSNGPMLERFEAAFAAFVGARHAVATTSGTAAMHLAAVTSGWTAGDEVVMSPLAAPLGSHLSRLVGVRVVFADVDVETLAVDPAALDAVVGVRTRGVVSTDANAVDAVARRHGLTVVQEFGASLHGSSPWPSVVTLTDETQLTAGRCGVLFTEDDAVARRWRALADETHGFAYRLGDVSSAIGIAQLEKLPRILVLRQMVAGEYERMLRAVPAVERGSAGTDAYWIRLDAAVDRDAFVAAMTRRGVTCRAHADIAVEAGRFPASESIAARSAALPFFPAMSPQQQERVVGELRDVLDAG